MKSYDHSDRILRRIAEGIENEIDCTQCANCCRVATVKLAPRDVERLAKALRISREKFLAEYAMESEEEGVILRRNEASGCIFLNGNECTVYDDRPGSIASRMWEMIDRACYCPIVYNSLEAFKVELKFKH